jgi:CBS domain-containing protein
MKVSECMSANVRAIAPDRTIREAAALMLNSDTGALLVGDLDAPQGIVTDRDIAVRAVAQGRGPDTPVAEVLSGDLVTVSADQDIEDVAITMSDRQVRRVVVLGDDGGVTGMISIGDLAKSPSGDTAEAALTGIAQSGGEHRQDRTDTA